MKQKAADCFGSNALSIQQAQSPVTPYFFFHGLLRDSVNYDERVLFYGHEAQMGGIALFFAVFEIRSSSSKNAKRK